MSHEETEQGHENSSSRTGTKGQNTPGGAWTCSGLVSDPTTSGDIWGETQPGMTMANSSMSLSKP